MNIENFGISICAQAQTFFVEFGVTVDSYNTMRNKTTLTDDDLKAIVAARKSARTAAVAVK
jgi:hypothetical protein